MLKGLTFHITFLFLMILISMRMMHYSSIACFAMKFTDVTAIFIQLNFVVNSEQDMGDIPNPSLRCFTLRCLEHSMKAGRFLMQKLPTTVVYSDVLSVSTIGRLRGMASMLGTMDANITIESGPRDSFALFRPLVFY